jgi:ubiquinone/menaquinone biosynthesis C-methylase UbiE
VRDWKQRLGRSYARLATNVAVRFPRLWPLVRPLIRKQFDLLAPVWDTMRSPDAFAPLESALATVAGPIESALDVGTGTGAGALAIAERFPAARVVGVDIAPEMVERARQKAHDQANLSFEVGDASALPYDDASFDLVTAANMIPFFDELARVVRPGGTLVVAFSLGPATPIYVTTERMRKALGSRGFMEFAEIQGGRGTALVARRG